MISYLNALRLKSVSFVFLLLLFGSCNTMKPSATKSDNNHFETFYVGEEGTQYFIKPISLKDEKSGEELVLDITFRYKNEIKDSATVNFSITSPVNYKSIDEIEISSKAIVLKSSKIGLLFNEKTNKGFSSRFTTKLDLQAVKTLFTDSSWEFSVLTQSQTNKYTTQNKASKAISAVRDQVFVLM